MTFKQSAQHELAILIALNENRAYCYVSTKYKVNEESEYKYYA